jgi:hypothetical protein
VVLLPAVPPAVPRVAPPQPHLAAGSPPLHLEVLPVVTGSRSLTFSTQRRPTRRRWVRVVVGLFVIVLVAAVVVVLTGGLLWGYAWARLGGTELPSLSADGDDALGAGGASSPEGTTTVLLALTEPTDATDPSGVPVVGPVALLQIGGPRGDDPVAVVLPAALPVSVDGEAPMPLADVHATGGPDLLLRTVVDYTQVDVDHLVTAATDAIPGLVEALGPVEACADTCVSIDAAEAEQAVAAYTDPSTTPAGSADALVELAVVVRGLGGATDPVAALTSPFATRRAIDILGSDVTTDAGLRGGALLPLADRIAASGDLTAVSLPAIANPDSGELVVLPEQAATRFALLREGGVPTASPEDDEAALIAEATVAVQNGTGTDGYAAALSTQVEALGVRVVGTENALSFDVERTRVAYGPDDPEAEAVAIVLARELGDAELVALDRSPSFEGEPVTVQVIGGSDLDTGEPTTNDEEP